MFCPARLFTSAGAFFQGPPVNVTGWAGVITSTLGSAASTLTAAAGAAVATGVGDSAGGDGGAGGVTSTDAGGTTFVGVFGVTTDGGSVLGRNAIQAPAAQAAAITTAITGHIDLGFGAASLVAVAGATVSSGAASGVVRMRSSSPRRLAALSKRRSRSACIALVMISSNRGSIS